MKEPRNEQTRQMSETWRLGILLALVGGYLDAYTYLCRGGVFANAQTGNIVLLGVHLVEREWMEAFYYLLPILAFVAGIFIAEAIKSRHRFNEAIHWRQIVVAIEIAALAVVAFLPVGEMDPPANIIVSFVCALQVETFRKVNGISCATTMCTGNLRSGTELLYRSRHGGGEQEKRDALQYYGVIATFILGAVLGSFFTQWLQGKAVLISCVGLAAAFLLMYKQNAGEQRRKKADKPR